jgi:hypothetical protein
LSPSPPLSPFTPISSISSSPPPPPPTSAPLRRSSRIASLQANLPHKARALFSEYIPFHDTHELIFLELPSSFASLETALAALEDGTVSPEPDTSDNPSWAEALASAEKEYWIAGGREKLQSLADLKVFALVPCSEVPPGHRPLKGKLVCKRKRDDNGNITRYKVRYVAKGFAQKYGIDYDKTTAPTAQLESLQLILHIAASLNWDIHQFDIKTTFLHGILPKMKQCFWNNLLDLKPPEKRIG